MWGSLRAPTGDTGPVSLAAFLREVGSGGGAVVDWGVTRECQGSVRGMSVPIGGSWVV